MIRIPAHASGNVKCKLRVKTEHGRNLVRHILRRMIMSVVHERHAAFMLCGETQRKFCRTHGVGLHADTEYLGFHARLDKLPVIRLR